MEKLCIDALQSSLEELWFSSQVKVDQFLYKSLNLFYGVLLAAL